MKLFKDLFKNEQNEHVEETVAMEEQVELLDDSQPVHQGAPTVLVVDDSRTVLASMQKMLHGMGYNCVLANNATDGINLATTVVPDLILMDIVMPEINGYQATRMLRQIDLTRGIPIIIISGNQMQTGQSWGERLGANGFLPKPLDKKTFQNMARQLLAENVKAAAVG